MHASAVRAAALLFVQMALLLPIRLPMCGFGHGTAAICWLILAVTRISAAEPSTVPADQVLPNQDNVNAVQHSADQHAVAASHQTYKRTSTLKDRLLLRGHVGIAGPAGALGVDVDVIPFEWLALESGIGMGQTGLQWGITSKLRYPTTRNGFFVGAGFGVSWGEYVHDSAGGLLAFLDQGEHRFAARRWAMARWYNFEVNLDRYEPEGRRVMHMAFGFGSLRNAAAYTCNDENSDLGCDQEPRRPVTMYLVFGWGISI
jgi:hypothetical protein